MTEKADKAPSKERRYKGASKAERQAERHEQLIAAGIIVIGNEGYQTTKVKQVCRQAGLTERYFYESFANKEALLCACYSKILQDLQLTLLSSAQLNDFEPLSAGKNALHALFTFIKHDRAAARLIMLEVLGVSPVVDAMYREAMHNIDGLILLVAKPESKLSPEGWDKNIVASGLTGAATQIARQWVLDDYQQSIETMVDSCFVLFKAAIEYFERLNSQD